MKPEVQLASIKKLKNLPADKAKKILEKLSLELQAKGNCKTFYCNGHSGGHSTS